MPARLNFVRRFDLDIPRRPRKQQQQQQVDEGHELEEAAVAEEDRVLPEASHVVMVDMDDMLDIALDVDTRAEAGADTDVDVAGVQVDGITTATRNRLHSRLVSRLSTALSLRSPEDDDAMDEWTGSEDLRTEATREEPLAPAADDLCSNPNNDDDGPAHLPMHDPALARGSGSDGMGHPSGKFTPGTFPTFQPEPQPQLQQPLQQEQSGGRSLNVGAPEFRRGGAFTFTLPLSVPTLQILLYTPVPAPGSPSPPACAQQGREKRQRPDKRDTRRIQFVREFTSMVFVLQDKTSNAIDLYNDMLRIVDMPAPRSYTAVTFTERLSSAAYRLRSTASASRATHISTTESPSSTRRFEDILLQRRSTLFRSGQFLEDSPTLKPIVHEIRIQNQVISLGPPIDLLPGVIRLLRRIQTLRYEIELQISASETLYTSLMQFNDDVLQQPLELIEAKYSNSRITSAKYVFNCLGDSLAHWRRLLTEIKRARTKFEMTETPKAFGVPAGAGARKRPVRRVGARHLGTSQSRRLSGYLRFHTWSSWPVTGDVANDRCSNTLLEFYHVRLIRQGFTKIGHPWLFQASELR
ncbi:hypothetical protein BC834DRAFT_846830 [Gloeopeniophorella convolvens]|nr:hypothetical protein BC834DRAFT_846830 [Gloeopeniophorella convolvens]